MLLLGKGTTGGFRANLGGRLIAEIIDHHAAVAQDRPSGDLSATVLCPCTCRGVVGDARDTIEGDGAADLIQCLQLGRLPLLDGSHISTFDVLGILGNRCQRIGVILGDDWVARVIQLLRLSQDGDAGKRVTHAVVVGNCGRVDPLAGQLGSAAHHAAQYQTLCASLRHTLGERAIQRSVVPHLLLHRLRQLLQHTLGEHALGDSPGHGAGADALAAARQHRIEVRDAQLVGQLTRAERDTASDDAAHPRQ